MTYWRLVQSALSMKAVVPPKRLPAAHAASTCCGWWSPVVSANARTSAGVTVHGRIAELAPVDDEVGRVVVALAVHDEHDRVACRAKAEVLWRRVPAFVPIPL